MPHLQVIGPLASVQTSSENISATRERVERGGGETLSDLLAAVLDRKLTREESSYLEAWPPGLKQGIRGAVVDALRRGAPIQVQWAPAYDYEVNMWEASAAATTGGLVIQMRSPYPGGAGTGARTSRVTAAGRTTTTQKARKAVRKSGRSKRR